MLSTLQVIVPILMAFIALLFTIARATPEEKAKVFGWGRQSAYVGLILLMMGSTMYVIHAFLTGDTPPTRGEIANFVFSTLMALWYAYLFFAHMGDIRSASRRNKIKKLEAELADARRTTLKLEIEENVLEKVHALFSAQSQVPVKTEGNSSQD